MDQFDKTQYRSVVRYRQLQFVFVDRDCWQPTHTLEQSFELYVREFSIFTPLPLECSINQRLNNIISDALLFLLENNLVEFVIRLCKLDIFDCKHVHVFAKLVMN
eukprot:scaffold3502_cov111-Cylindrotheca_fusiformis.AAC.4